MARSLRLEYPVAVNLVMARGNQGQLIFQDDPNGVFLATLAEPHTKTGLRMHTYGLWAITISSCWKLWRVI